MTKERKRSENEENLKTWIKGKRKRKKKATKRRRNRKRRIAKEEQEKRDVWLKRMYLKL